MVESVKSQTLKPHRIRQGGTVKMKDCKHWREAHKLSTDDVVNTIKQYFPRYNEIVHSIVENPLYGVMNVPEVDEILDKTYGKVKGVIIPPILTLSKDRAEAFKEVFLNSGIDDLQEFADLIIDDFIYSRDPELSRELNRKEAKNNGKPDTRIPFTELTAQLLEEVEERKNKAEGRENVLV